MKKFKQYSDQIARLYSGEDVLDEHEFLTRNITFQVTDDCCCACTYCLDGDTKITMSDFTEKNKTFKPILFAFVFIQFIGFIRFITFSK